jgi:hypothetical protein
MHRACTCYHLLATGATYCYVWYLQRLEDLVRNPLVDRARDVTLDPRKVHVVPSECGSKCMVVVTSYGKVS